MTRTMMPAPVQFDNDITSQYGWQIIRPDDGKSVTVMSFEVLYDTVTYGKWVKGTYKATLLDADRETILQILGEGEATSGLSSVKLTGLNWVIPPGKCLKIEVKVWVNRLPSQWRALLPSGVTILPMDDQSAGKLLLKLAAPQVYSPPPPADDGNDSAADPKPRGPASMFGQVYETTPRHNAWATMTRWNYPPSFGVKLLKPPPPPPQLFYPTTAGPNFEGQCSGLLVTPAVVYDIQDPELEGPVTLEVAGVKFKFGSGDISSSVAVGILPFKES